jgi:hypothetical protein
MANKEEHLSPEEKLLRVIQGGGAKPKDAPSGVAGGGAPVATASPVPAPSPSSGRAAAETKASPTDAKAASASAAGSSAEKGKLRLSGEAKGVPAADSKPSGKPAANAKPVASSRPVATPKRSAPMLDFSLRSVNIVLAAIVLIVLLFTGHEIWANVRASDSAVSVGGVVAPVLTEKDEYEALPPLEGLLDAVDVRPLFAVMPGPVQEESRPPPPPAPHEYCSLLGISLLHDSGEQEAIIKDSKQGKMLYLKVGDEIPADGQTWKVKEIQADRVIFANGNRESVVQ